MDAMQISRTGLEVEWRRLEVIAQNIANANTTSAGEPYRPMRLVTGTKAPFADHLAGPRQGYRPAGVTVQGLEQLDLPPRLVHEPSHPHANSDGFVAYPGVDHAGEMALMVKTARAYEANVVAMNTARQMYSKALDLGRR